MFHALIIWPSQLIIEKFDVYLYISSHYPLITDVPSVFPSLILRVRLFLGKQRDKSHKRADDLPVMACSLRGQSNGDGDASKVNSSTLVGVTGEQGMNWLKLQLLWKASTSAQNAVPSSSPITIGQSFDCFPMPPHDASVLLQPYDMQTIDKCLKLVNVAHRVSRHAAWLQCDWGNPQLPKWWPRGSLREASKSASTYRTFLPGAMDLYFFETPEHLIHPGGTSPFSDIKSKFMVGDVSSLVGYHQGGINGSSEIHAMGVWIYLSERFKIILKLSWKFDFPVAGRCSGRMARRHRCVFNPNRGWIIGVKIVCCKLIVRSQQCSNP
jgi:hypothetical protein